jgi:Nucleotidyl transferase AbiEii toxin, Type IV TA system
LNFRLPTAEEVALFLDPDGRGVDDRELRIATVRDLARIAEVAHLLEVGYLGSAAVLTGGMAMRLRGSARLTMLDADLSATRGADVSEDDVRDVIEVQTEEITIVPERVRSDSDVLTVFPVSFSMRPPPVAVPSAERHFKVDLASRGLELGVDHVPFRHTYPFSLGLEDEEIPVMHLAEAVAEKTVGYGMFQLGKHFADLAFAVDPHGGALAADSDTLRELTRKKLEGFVARFPELARANGISDLPSLEPTFTQDRYMRVLKFQWQQAVRFLGDPAHHYTFEQAKTLVQERLVPLLFPR